MSERMLGKTLGAIAEREVPDDVDLWPAVERAVRGRQRGARARALPAAAMVGALALVLVAGVTLISPALLGGSAEAAAIDIARHSPAVAAALSGDIAVVTVTSIVDDIAAVVVRDTSGREVDVNVDLRSRIVTSVYHGPQLSDVLAAQALRVVEADPRTADLLARGASIGRVLPIEVTGSGIDPATGSPVVASETWAQVPLSLDGREWAAYVDLPRSRIDQLIGPDGSQVPLP